MNSKITPTLSSNKNFIRKIPILNCKCMRNHLYLRLNISENIFLSSLPSFFRSFYIYSNITNSFFVLIANLFFISIPIFSRLLYFIFFTGSIIYLFQLIVLVGKSNILADKNQLIIFFHLQ